VHHAGPRYDKPVLRPLSSRHALRTLVGGRWATTCRESGRGQLVAAILRGGFSLMWLASGRLSRSLQLGVLCLGLFEYGDTRVGALPKRGEVLIGSPGLGCISCQHKRPTQLQVRQRSDGVGENNPPVIARSGLGETVSGTATKATRPETPIASRGTREAR